MLKRFLLIALVVLLIALEFADYRNTHDEFILVDFVSDFVQRIRSEVVIAVIVVLAMWIFNDWRAVQREKALLMTQLGSPDSGFAAEAARILRVRGWLTDGSLRGLFLVQANLHGAKLWRADLHGAELMEANLAEANLHKTDLSNAKLWEADLHGAELMEANLYKADLRKADLRDVKLWRADLRQALLEQANLRNANLRGANLRNALLQRANLHGINLMKANLQGVDFAHARFDEQVILPDGTHWSPATDLTRFTLVTHINFWRPDSSDDDPPTWYRLDATDDDPQD